MSRINNIKTINNLILGSLVFAILSLAVIALIPKETKAKSLVDIANSEGGRNYHYGPMGDEDNDENSGPVAESENPSNGAVNNSASLGYNPYSTGNVAYPATYQVGTVTKSIAKSNAAKSNTEDAEENEQGGNNLAASALLGTGGFMPTGIVQWIMIAIMVLVIVILVRRTFYAPAYHAAPLKHD